MANLPRENSGDIGLIGLGVMGRNFALNMADHGFSVVGYDRDANKTRLLEKERSARQAIDSAGDLGAFCEKLRRAPGDPGAGAGRRARGCGDPLPRAPSAGRRCHHRQRKWIWDPDDRPMRIRNDNRGEF